MGFLGKIVTKPMGCHVSSVVFYKIKIRLLDDIGYKVRQIPKIICPSQIGCKQWSLIRWI